MSGLLPVTLAQSQEAKPQEGTEQPDQREPAQPGTTPDSENRPMRRHRMGPGGPFGHPPGRPGMWRRQPAFERWRHLTPEQRQKVLEKLPPERRRRLQEQFDRLDHMPEPQRRRLEQRYERFRSLPPEQQERIREVYRHIRELPEDRRRMVHREYRYLATLPENERQARMQSEEFRNQFSTEERGMLNDLVTLMPEM